MKFIIGIIIGLILGSMVTVWAGSTYISENALWNKVFDGTNKIKVIGV